MRWIYILILPIFLSSCYGMKEYEQVFIPSACDVPKREKPKKTGVLIEDIRAILIYDEIISKDLSFCRGEKEQ